jgi:hypothetical protein
MSDNRISYSVNEAAKAAGIGLTKLREEIRANRLVARKLGKRTLEYARRGWEVFPAPR